MAARNARKDEPRGPWSFEEIRAILDLLAERGIDEFELEKDGFRVRVKRGAASAANQRPAAAIALEGPRTELNPGRESPIASSSFAPAAAAEESENHHVVKSPVVGTFYAAPKPGAPPYVKVGEAIRKGQVLCVIEAMKLMNEIEADADGEITKIFVENAQPVEYGQSLFVLTVRLSPNPLPPRPARITE